MISSFDRISIVAKEMRHLLWSSERLVRDGGLAWWNCADHAAMTAALMWINGYDVDALAGQAFFAQSRKANGASPCLHHVKRHWWITAKNVGVIDFSPDLSVSSPEWDPCAIEYVFANRVVATEEWSFHQAKNMDAVKRKLASMENQVGKFACIYLRQNEKPFAGSPFLSEPMISNQNKEPWAQAVLLCHLYKLLNNDAESLAALNLEDAWERLRALPGSDVRAVTDRLAR